MSLLCSIIQKLIDNSFSINMQEYNCYEYWGKINTHKNNNTFNMYDKPNYFLYMYCSNLHYSNNEMKNFAQKKYFYLNDFMNNIFISKNIKNAFMDYFQKAQRTYFALAKVANIYKYKKATVKINVDLYLNELNPKNKNVITIIQKGSKYLFVGSDLVKIINASLLNSSHFFAEPLHPKNPFNNIPFDHATLYNIYFHIKHNCVNNSILFHLFFKVNFDIDKFLYENESFIRDEAIKNYAKNTPSSVLQHDLKSMLFVNHRYTKKLFIHDDIPIDTLIDIFRPYLYLYYLHRYSVKGTEKKVNSYFTLKYKLRDFVEYNPLFGRKAYKIVKKIVQVKCNVTNNMIATVKNISTFSFNLDHINFYKKNIENSKNIFDFHYNNNISFRRLRSPSYESEHDNIGENNDYENNNQTEDDNQMLLDNENDNQMLLNNEDDNQMILDNENDNQMLLDNDDMEEHIIAVENLPEGEESDIESEADSTI